MSGGYYCCVWVLLQSYFIRRTSLFRGSLSCSLNKKQRFFELCCVNWPLSFENFSEIETGCIPHATRSKCRCLNLCNLSILGKVCHGFAPRALILWNRSYREKCCLYGFKAIYGVISVVATQTLQKFASETERLLVLPHFPGKLRTAQ